MAKPRIQATERLDWYAPVSVISGLVFLVVIFVTAIFIPDPTRFQIFVFRVVIALAAAAFGATIPGFLKVDLPLWGQGLVAAGGALALFVVIFNINPPRLLSGGENPEVVFDGGNKDHASQDFRGLDLGSFDLEDQNFDDSVLVDCNMRNSWISRARFKKANLSNADLRDTEGIRATFENASLIGTDCSMAMLNGAVFRGADLTRARFFNTSLREVDFSETNLTDAQFAGADITGTNFSSTTGLTQQQISSATYDSSFHRTITLPAGLELPTPRSADQ